MRQIIIDQSHVPPNIQSINMIMIIKGKEAVIQKGEIVGLKIRMINSSSTDSMDCELLIMFA